MNIHVNGSVVNCLYESQATIATIEAIDFLFVDKSTQDDRPMRRRMRQHVMKGKNAGGKISRSSRLSTIPREQRIWYLGKVDERFGIAFEMVGLPVMVHPRGASCDR